jgi:uncharacterized membrane protein YdjX (TVP38/TMEM64 family)
MTKQPASRTREYLWLAVVCGLLIASLLFVRHHEQDIEAYIRQHPLAGLLLYIALNIVDALIAPGATLPLIPVAADAWGRILAALITTAGWAVGSLMAFLIARRWGYPVVKKLTSRERLRQLAKYIPDDLFWSVVLLRVVMPMDVLSYVLGLLTDLSWNRYVIATALGLLPSAFLLTYLGHLRHGYEIIMFVIGAGVVAAATVASRRRGRRA